MKMTDHPSFAKGNGKLACIGIGSNAIRMLCAGWDGAGLCALRRERRGTRLFAGLVDGRLTQQSMQSSVDAVSELADIARAAGAQETFLFATSAVRDAANGNEFMEACRRVTGCDPLVLSGEEEAVFSFLGACGAGRSAIIDIGGGSTEFTLGQDGTPSHAVSLQVGAVRMTGIRPVTGIADYEATLQECRMLIRSGAAELLPEGGGRIWTGVGGTMTTLGAMERAIPYFDEATCEGMTITRARAAQWGRKLAGETLEERRQTPGLMPQRADIIPAGIAILEAAMDVFDIPEIRLSSRGNMDGFLKKKFAQRA